MKFLVIEGFKQHINIKTFYNKKKWGIRNNPLSYLEKTYKKGYQTFLLYEMI